MPPELSEKRARVFRALHEIAVATGGVLDLSALARLVGERSRELLGGDSVGVYVLDEDAGSIRPLYTSDSLVGPAGTSIREGEGSVGRAITEHQPVAVDDYQEWSQGLPSALQRGVRSVAAVPLLRADRALGAIVVRHYTPHRTSPEELETLSLLAAQVAPAFEAVRLYERVKLERQRELALREMTQALAAHLDERWVLDLAVQQASELLKAPYARVWLVDSEGGLRCAAAEGFSETKRVGDRLPAKSVTGTVATGTIVNLSDVRQEPRWYDDALVARTGLHRYLAAPIQRAGTHLGTLTVMRKEDCFTAAEQRLLAGLADAAAVAVDNARIYRQARDEVAERERAVLALKRRDGILAAIGVVAERLLSSPDWTLGVADMLDLLGTAAGASRAGIFQTAARSEDEVTAFQRYTWSAPGVRGPVGSHGQHGVLMRAVGLGRWIEILSRGGAISARVAELPSEERELLGAQGILSLVVVPIFAGSRWWGFAAFDECSADREWLPAEVDALRVAAGIAGAAIERTHLERHHLELAREQAARAQAEEAVRVRDEFLSVAAHELKTPITSLLGHAQLALRRLERDGTLSRERIEHTFHTINQQSQRLTRLVSQLLDISRIESGRLILDREEADVVELVADAVESARLRTEQHTIELRSPTRVVASVDPVRLEQVLTNLVDNAIKYSPSGGAIEITVGVDAQRIEVGVRDHGIGIPEEHRARVFDRFYQVHTGTPFASAAGMGLGLHVSRQIVELHGGNLVLETPKDGGSRFVIMLPRRA